MRTIRVSTEVFAAIWKAQSPGERSESAILARLLGVSNKQRSIKGSTDSNDDGWSEVKA